jgi:hypothetical protein
MPRTSSRWVIVRSSLRVGSPPSRTANSGRANNSSPITLQGRPPEPVIGRGDKVASRLAAGALEERQGAVTPESAVLSLSPRTQGGGIVTAHSLLYPGRGVLSRRFPLEASTGRRSRRQPGPFHGPAFRVVMAVEAGILAGMAFAPGWAVVVLFVLMWGLLFAYTALSRRAWF